MINRVLIRMKVVQMLYSYFLTQNDFNIAEIEKGATHDARYAHNLTMAIVRLIPLLAGSGEPPVGNPRLNNNKYLSTQKLPLSLRTDPDIKGMMMRAGISGKEFSGCLVKLHEEILNSALYRSLVRSHDVDIEREAKFWKDVVNLIIAKDTDFAEAARDMEGYTRAGFERGIINAISIIDSFGSNYSQLSNARKSLEASLDKAYELYHALLWLPVELTRLQDLRLDLAQHKYLPTEAELNPDLRFVNNSFVKAIEECEAMETFRKDHPFDWTAREPMLSTLLDAVVNSAPYSDYMAKESVSTEDDAELWRNLFKDVIFPSDVLAEAMEEQSVFWNDDLEIMSTFVLKTIRRNARRNKDTSFELLPQYKDEEDARFGAELFNFTVENRDVFRDYIDRFTNAKKWESSRLAFMDVVIIMTALGEILHFPAIPLAVSFNEYIEIAKSYSTLRSGEFVNGLVYSIVEELKRTGQLNKA